MAFVMLVSNLLILLDKDLRALELSSKLVVEDQDARLCFKKSVYIFQCAICSLL